MNTEYILTESFPTNIDEENCQQGPKYLLKGTQKISCRKLKKSYHSQAFAVR